MRVGDASSKKVSGGKSSSSSNKKTSSLFSSEMEKRDREFTDYRLELNALRDEIESVADSLDREPSEENFFKFRDLIRALTKKVSSEAYKIQNSRATFSRPEGFYQIIATINTELDSLYREIRFKHKKHIDLTNKIVRLKGLVVDLLA